MYAARSSLTTFGARQIEAREINATISADGTVAFEDDPPVSVTKTQMDAVLARAQAQEKMLRALEREMAVSKEYLSKVRHRIIFFRLRWARVDRRALSACRSPTLWQP